MDDLISERRSHAAHYPLSARRALVLSADIGGGHDATAAGLEESILELWPGSEILKLDMLDLLGPEFGRFFRRLYVANVEKTPWLYEFFYAALWRHRWFATASKGLTGIVCASRLVPEINRFDPDLILSTYPLATSGLSWLRRHRGLAVPSGAWVSDFAPHPFWVYSGVDMNYVMHEMAVPHARAAEPLAPVEVGSPPVAGSFAPGDRRTARRKVGVRADAFVVLVSCGTYAFGDTVGMVQALLKSTTEVQVVAACGHNRQTWDRLAALEAPPERLLVLGWTDAMADYVRAADLVVTNAGGATALEALACDRPILMFRPIAAHGVANAQLMVASGLADVCNDETTLIDYVRTAVADREGLENLERSADEYRHGRDRRSSLLRLTAPREAPVSHRAWPMRSADAFFTHVESENIRQEIGAVLALDPVRPGRSLDVHALRRVVESRAPGLPPLRRRLVRRPSSKWIVQDGMNVDEHVHECVVSADASDAEMNDAVDEFWSTPLPVDKPAWQMLLVRGRADGRSVLAVKMHHAQGDGVSALGLLDRLLSTDIHDTAGEHGNVARSSPRRSVLKVDGRAFRVVQGLWNLATRGRPPKAEMNRRRIDGTARHFVGVPLPTTEVRAAARALHAQPHELLLSVIATALRRVLGAAGLLDGHRSLRVMVPIAMRAPRLDHISGNWTGVVALDLPVGPMTAAERVAAVRTELRRRVRHGEPQAAQFVMQIAGRLPPAVHCLFARAVYTKRFFNTIVSYMPGPRSPRWCAGARVRATYPVLPLTRDVPLTIGAVLSGDTVGLGLLYAPSLDLNRGDVVDAMTDAFHDVAGAGSVSTSGAG